MTWQGRPRRDIRLCEVSFRYSQDRPDVVRDVSLVIPAGAIVGFMGANGSGKTTLLDLVSGLLVPQSGHIEVDGVRLERANHRAWQSNIAYVPQQVFLLEATLAENIDTVSVPPNVAPILAETRDPYLRETLRDLGCAQTFRRDLYRKGMAPMPAAEQQMLLENLTLAGMGMAAPEGGVTFATPIGSVTGRPEVYEPLLSMLEAGTLSVRQARDAPAFAGRALTEPQADQADNDECQQGRDRQDGSQDPIPHRGIDMVLDAGLKAGERAGIDARPQSRQGQ